MSIEYIHELEAENERLRKERDDARRELAELKVIAVTATHVWEDDGGCRKRAELAETNAEFLARLADRNAAERDAYLAELASLRGQRTLDPFPALGVLNNRVRDLEKKVDGWRTIHEESSFSYEERTQRRER